MTNGAYECTDSCGARVLSRTQRHVQFTQAYNRVSRAHSSLSPAAMAKTTLADLPTYSVSTTRLKSIYSDLSRQKTSNPTAFSANIDWWRRTLSSYVERGLHADHPDTLVLDATPELAESLRYEGVGKPLGLAAVIVRHNIRIQKIDISSITPRKD